ncbi:unnamed protein product, partial [Urochloa humidicola]
KHTTHHTTLHYSLGRHITNKRRSTMSSVDATTGGEKKTSWPEVVGLPVEEAKKIILKDMPDADIVVLPAGSPVTMDFRSNRVRVFVDTVARTPTVG